MAERLFDEATLRKLERLTLIANKVRVGAIKGERRSVRRGTSLEFADYRNYTRGDDLRRVDWNLYARLERPFLKLFEEEEDLAVHVIVDASASMGWPEDGEGVDESHHKFRYAMRLAGALAHIGLATGDQVSVTLLRGQAVAERWGPARGRGQTLRLLAWLEEQETGGETDLDAALTDSARRGGRPGLALVISDMLSQSGYRDGLNALQGRGNEVGLLHVLAPEEIEPPLAGDLRLVDLETGDPQDVSVDGAMRGLYRRRLLDWRDEMAAHCAGRDAHYVAIETGTPWEEVVLYELRLAGMVK
jgi:uncharacterized protein (DUF58 family)